MAATFTPNDGINFAKRMIGDAPVDDTNLKYRVLNTASNLIHMAAPWRWSVGQYAAIPLLNSTTDLSVTDPGDVLYLLGGRVEHLDGRIDYVKPSSYLPTTTTLKGIPTEVMLASATIVRVYPPVSDLVDLPGMRLYYKKKNTVITSGNAATATTLLFPDEWFFVFEQACLMFAYQFMNDSRGGSAQFQQGQAVYTGQWGITMGLLQYMIEKEKPLAIDGVPSQG